MIRPNAATTAEREYFQRRQGRHATIFGTAAIGVLPAMLSIAYGIRATNSTILWGLVLLLTFAGMFLACATVTTATLARLLGRRGGIAIPVVGIVCIAVGALAWWWFYGLEIFALILSISILIVAIIPVLTPRILGLR